MKSIAIVIAAVMLLSVGFANALSDITLTGLDPMTFVPDQSLFDPANFIFTPVWVNPGIGQINGLDPMTFVPDQSLFDPANFHYVSIWDF